MKAWMPGFAKQKVPRTLVLVVMAWFLSCGVLYAQLDVDGPIRLTHVEGYVANTSGKPVANVEVTLSWDETVLLSTHTDQNGAFHFDHASGNYWLRVARSEYAPAARQIVVRTEIVTALEKRKLYVILGPGACADACSSVFTSKKEFDRAIRRSTSHHY